LESTDTHIDYAFKDISDRNPKLRRDIQTGMIFIEGSWGSVTFNNEPFKMYGMYIHHKSEHSVNINRSSNVFIIVWLRCLEIRHGDLANVLLCCSVKDSNDIFII
jgi:hypothetical protein